VLFNVKQGFIKVFGNKNKVARMKIFGILHDFGIFFIGKGPFKGP
jgi:hypothetical protein